MEYQFDRKVPPSFSVGKFLYEPKHPSCYGPDQDREHDKPNSIWNRPNQGVFRVRVYVHTTAIARGRTAAISGSRPYANHTDRFYRESAASLC
jgi:hypothetical protein